ncbi:hypothetical protein AX15_004141 [Amanita polypyramis BW_CC]|nr:hypothetical protein AX15_004141 [Amanita polypyramis BW_CC]
MNCVSSQPDYWRVTRGPGQVPESNELPSYTRHNILHPPVVRQEPTEHIYQLAEGKSRPWVTLKIYSSAKSAKSLPVFLERRPITASLEVQAEKGDSIHQIMSIVTGRIITGANTKDSFTFLSETLPIWSKSPESSRVPSPSEGTTGSKLIGECVWPISITLPKAVNVPLAGGESCFYRLPETFLERHTRVSVQYDFTILISRGKLRASSQVKTSFGFVPHTRPELPSLLRQLAYQESTPIPGPSSDPDGWKMLPAVVTRGTMSKSHQVEVRCTVNFRSQLSYTRGSVLPCYLTLEGCDRDALDAFSMPSSIVVVLRRRVRYYQANTSARQDVAWNESFEDMGSAIWWPSHDGRNDHSRRHMEGEIRLARDLRPTSAMGHYSLSYSVILCPFDSARFSTDSAPLLSEPVEITTLYSKGPRPLAYSPSAYEQSSRKSSDQFFAHY